MSAGQNMTRVVGPSVAGIVIGAIGVGPTFLAQAVAVAVSFILVLGIMLPPRAARSRGRAGDLRWHSTRRLSPGSAVIVSPGLDSDALRVPLHRVPERVRARHSPHRSGGTGTADGGFRLRRGRGVLLVASAARSEGIGRLLLGMTVLYGLPIVGVALSRTLWITLPFALRRGDARAAFMSGNNALVQHRVTDDVRGRVMGAYMLTWGLMPLGSLPMGMVGDRIGTPLPSPVARSSPRCWRESSDWPHQPSVMFDVPQAQAGCVCPLTRAQFAPTPAQLEAADRARRRRAAAR